MMPTDEEKTKILEAQMSNSDLPLGSAEQFLLTLCSISELSARLNLWTFKLDYETIESVRHHIFPYYTHCIDISILNSVLHRLMVLVVG